MKTSFSKILWLQIEASMHLETKLNLLKESNALEQEIQKWQRNMAVKYIDTKIEVINLCWSNKCVLIVYSVICSFKLGVLLL